MTDNLSWYEIQWQGRFVGTLFVLGGGAVVASTAAHALDVYRHVAVVRALPRLMLSPRALAWLAVAGGSVAMLTGWYLRAKLYIRDPAARVHYRRQFEEESLMSSLGRFGWSNLLQVVSVADVRDKLRAETRERDFAFLWRTYGRDHLQAALDRHVVRAHELGEYLERELNGPTSGLDLLRALSQYAAWLVRNGCCARELLVNRLRDDLLIRSLGFSAFVEAGGLKLYEDHFVPPDELRTRFLSDLARDVWTWDRLIDRHAGVLKTMFEADIVHPRELRAIFQAERDRSELVAFMEKNGDWPMATHGRDLLPDAEFYEMMRLWNSYKAYCAKKKQGIAKKQERLQREQAEANATHAAQVAQTRALVAASAKPTAAASAPAASAPGTSPAPPRPAASSSASFTATASASPSTSLSLSASSLPTVPVAPELGVDLAADAALQRTIERIERDKSELSASLPAKLEAKRLEINLEWRHASLRFATAAAVAVSSSTSSGAVAAYF